MDETKRYGYVYGYVHGYALCWCPVINSEAIINQARLAKNY